MTLYTVSGSSFARRNWVEAAPRPKPVLSNTVPVWDDDCAYTFPPNTQRVKGLGELCTQCIVVADLYYGHPTHQQGVADECAANQHLALEGKNG